jgi:hypothetical protein
MSAEHSIRDLLTEGVPNVWLMPVLHERIDMAAAVRLALDEIKPEAVAVELPTTIGGSVVKAVSRLPKISVILSSSRSEEPLLWVVAPGDPLVEAVRWALEKDRPVAMIDPDVPYREQHRDPMPDPHLIWELGPARFKEILDEVPTSASSSESDLLRERGMAYHIDRLAGSTQTPILAVMGAAHVAGVARALQQPTAVPLARQTRSDIELRHLHPDSLTGLMTEAPLLHAVYETLRDGSIPEQENLDATIAPRVELVKAGLELISGKKNEDTRLRCEAVVRYCAAESSTTTWTGRPRVNRRTVPATIWKTAAASFEKQTRESIHEWQRLMFADFARRHSRIQGQLVPGLYEWVIAARGVGDDNLAWEVFDVARSYPWQGDEAELPTARIDGDQLDLGTRKVRFRRRFFRTKNKPVLVPVQRHPTAPEDPGEWLQAFDGSGICSYPPEDIVVEEFGRRLKERAKSIIAAELSRCEPFVGSFLDGVDIRETTRRWHEGQIWVREDGRSPGDAGSVVVIFDEDRGGAEFPYLMTWLGEHEQESDMALYASNPTEQIVGPGIMRATYGGFMLTYPPGRLYDVWQDSDYAKARSKAEVLLMAGVDYSLKKLVVHVAARPPGERMSRYAASQSKKIIHIPIGTLSPPSLRKLRVVHILAGREKREIAKEYVW